MATKAAPLPTIGRQGPTGSAKKTAAASKNKGMGKGNASILSFFKKSDGFGGEDGGLFVEEKGAAVKTSGLEINEPDASDVHSTADTDSRYNEQQGPVKRRKMSKDEELFGPEIESPVPQQAKEFATGSNKRAGPFLEDSDSEDEEVEHGRPVDEESSSVQQASELLGASLNSASAVAPEASTVATGEGEEAVPDGGPQRPSLIQEETSYGLGDDAFKDFEDLEDFDEDLFEGGDEFIERRYMEEQARLEEMENEKDYDTFPSETEVGIKQEEACDPDTAQSPSCPICNISLGGVSDGDASIHVNNCLDGNPTSLPDKKKPPTPPAIMKSERTASPAPFRRAVRPAKPPQVSPFQLGTESINGGSAFNKLMSGHSEESAWAEAAAAENASRGKPAYQRTCPFYKIMPGLYICVDAFRYGAVEGCKAYFLSHFHSDHYIGLTSSWCHGPIYCSHVTANLVRQQLRVDPKWVVDLEFEKPVEVPGTRGVKVTMIPANHCPGSSLYLFEKTVSPPKNGKGGKLQRILHCGDFRACKAHVEHPLLMPDVQDAITGKKREQKIDVCYLDTTYLNPKYAFPNQEAVIKACADMCVSLSKVSVDESDGWEQMKRQRAGEGMVKFVRKESNPGIKEEPPEDDDDKDGMKLQQNPNGSQQILTSTNGKERGRLLVIVGTYSIGKERICMGIARALDSKIYAPPGKLRICAALEDPELNARLTSNPREAQVHMTPLFEIRAETLDDYLKDYFPHFTRAVGFRPSGWNYRPPNSRFVESPSVQTVLYSDNWKSSYSMKELVPQRGSTSRASCFGVPYSEHSSFRELTMFCTALRIEKIIPTVNVGSAKSRERMKAWCERWAVERRKNGLFKVGSDDGW